MLLVIIDDQLLLFLQQLYLMNRLLPWFLW